MKINLSTLSSILLPCNARFVNCDASIEFEHVDVLSYASKKVETYSMQQVLYCLTRSTSEKDKSWYGLTFDREDKIKILVERFSKWVFLTDNKKLPEQFPENSFVVVEDIYLASKVIYGFVLKSVSPRVCGVTGSVGKTTTVGMLEDVLEGLGHKTLRIYSKRITPLCLFDFVINNLEEDHEFIVMEYSMYYKWHISYLCGLLPPAFSGILNIESSHIGIDGIEGFDDIFESKSALLKSSGVSFTHVDLSEALEKFGIDSNIFNHVLQSSDPRFKPFVATKLSYTQSTLVQCLVSKCIQDYDIDTFIRIINLYQPKENRLRRIKSDNCEFIFDGDATNASRLNHLSQNYYDESALILCDVDFGDEPLLPQKDLLVGVFRSFGKVLIAKSLKSEYFEFVNQCAEKALGMNTDLRYFDLKIGESISNPFSSKGTSPQIFVHWGSYWRNQVGTINQLEKMF